ncbi:hypothetical protein Pcinc_038066 [Petrolisthes cinctipes]|uniref:Uncharacterized protein n=1 Tax=Petrolisthes cinctipes TaxID=88211 RepID=A0AAE1EKU7_PETCI|nr:hypothetical protein Pcinc_038066 [Petrolisthes cinctipes]
MTVSRSPFSPLSLPLCSPRLPTPSPYSLQLPRQFPFTPLSSLHPFPFTPLIPHSLPGTSLFYPPFPLSPLLPTLTPLPSSSHPHPSPLNSHTPSPLSSPSNPSTPLATLLFSFLNRATSTFPSL